KHSSTFSTDAAGTPASVSSSTHSAGVCFCRCFSTSTVSSESVLHPLANSDKPRIGEQLGRVQRLAQALEDALTADVCTPLALAQPLSLDERGQHAVRNMKRAVKSATGSPTRI